MHCCNCQSTIGDEAKVQPTTVDGEVYCPRCFVWRRANAEPNRFNAAQMAAVRCQLCGWVTVSFGCNPISFQAPRCGHCLNFSALLLPLSDLPLTKREAATMEQLAREAGIEPKRIRARS